MDLTINSRLIIPSKELKWRFSKASGPGGQSVNTSNNRVELILDIKNSSVINTFDKQRLLVKLKNRIINGRLTIVASEERSQHHNRQLALVRLVSLLGEGLKMPPKSRGVTKPTRASRKRRINSKKHRSVLKQKRQSKISIED